MRLVHLLNEKFLFLFVGAAVVACASAPSRDPAGCAAPADRAEVVQIQVGWSRLDPGLYPAPSDPRMGVRNPRQAETLATDLLEQCRKGVSMETLQERYSEAPRGTVVVGSQARVPYRAAALCLQKGECALVRSDVAFHVLKRIQ